MGYYERRFARRGDLKIIHYRQPTLKQTAQMIQHLGDIEKRSWMAGDANAHLRFATPEGHNVFAFRKVHLTPKEIEEDGL